MPATSVWRNVVQCCCKNEKSKKATAILLDWVSLGAATCYQSFEEVYVLIILIPPMFVFRSRLPMKERQINHPSLSLTLSSTHVKSVVKKS
jgi:hypothetical protein